LSPLSEGRRLRPEGKDLARISREKKDLRNAFGLEERLGLPSKRKLTQSAERWRLPFEKRNHHSDLGKRRTRRGKNEQDRFDAKGRL